MGDSVRLQLDGSVAMETFARVASKFSELLGQLTTERRASKQVRWVLSDLRFGSAVVEAEPLPNSTNDKTVAASLTRDFFQVARLALNEPSATDRKSISMVREIASIATENGHEVAFRTVDGMVTYTVENTPVTSERGVVPEAMGTVRGRVQTLQMRGHHQMVVYDLVHDTPVKCQLDDSLESVMRDAWGRVVDITGLVTRDASTDRPRSIRSVSDITVLPSAGDDFDFRRARGAVPRRPDATPSEVLIRRVRDAV